MYLVAPAPNFSITIVSNFFWVLQSSQEKSNTMVRQNLWGGGEVNKVHYALRENCEWGKNWIYSLPLPSVRPSGVVKSTARASRMLQASLSLWFANGMLSGCSTALCTSSSHSSKKSSFLNSQMLWSIHEAATKQHAHLTAISICLRTHRKHPFHLPKVSSAVIRALLSR